MIYVENPKVGSTLVKATFAPSPRTARALLAGHPTYAMAAHDPRSHGLPSLSALAKEELEEALSGSWCVFSTVRDPYSRLVSAWANKILLGASPFWVDRQPDAPDDLGELFRAFARSLAVENADLLVWDGHFRTQVENLLPHKVPYTNLVPIQEISSFLEDHGILVHSGPSNPGLRIPVGAAYDASTRELVASLYHADFRAFGFETDPELGESWPYPLRPDLKHMIDIVRQQNRLIYGISRRFAVMDKVDRELAGIRRALSGI